MNLKEVLTSVTENFFEDKNKSFIYFSVPENLMYRIAESNSKKFNVHVIDLKEDINPVKPFYTIMKELSPSAESIEKYAYSLHKNILKSFFTTGDCSVRLDIINLNEIYYELLMLGTFGIKIFEEHFTDNFVILNSQLLPKESIKFINHIKDKVYKGKLIFCFNNNEIEQSSPAVEKFYHNLENDKDFYDITNYEDELIKETALYHKEQKLPTFEELYKEIKNCRMLLSLDQGVTRCRWVNDNISLFDFTIQQTRDLYFEIGLCMFYANQFDEALFFLNRILTYRIEDETELATYLVLSRAYMAKNMNNESLRCALIIEDRLSNDKTSPYYALAYMLDYSVSQKKDSEHSVDKFYTALELLNYSGLKNNYVLTSLDIPWVAMNVNELRDKMMSIVDNAIKIATELGNDYALSTGYNWKGIILLHSGKRDEAHIWYNKCNEIRTSIGDLPAIIKIRNGLSYEYLISTKYKESYDLLNELSDKLIDIKENTEIIITLNNIANTLFYSRHFAQAFVVYQKILQLLVFFHFEKETVTSFLPEYNDILIHKTFLELCDGNINRAKINFYNIMHNKRNITKINDPLKYLFEAILLLQEKKYEEAYKAFDNAEQSFSNYSSAQTFRHIFIIYEFCLFLKKENLNNKIVSYLNKVIPLARTFNLSYFMQDENTPISIEDYIQKPEIFAPLKLDFNKLDEKINKEQLLTQMHKHLRDSQFLNKINSLETESYEDSRFMQAAIHILMEYTLSAAIYIAIKEDTKWKCHGSYSKIKGLKITEKDWESLFNKYESKRGNCDFIFDSEKGWYYAKSSEHVIPGAMILVPSSAVPLTAEELSVLNIAIANIKSQYVIRRQNERLMFISSTDQLSMLNNRRALQEKLNIESEMIHRYLDKRSKYFQISISFIDLDNFKYINDTFGHEMGDLIIAKFADLLRQIYRRVDFISRFGGDEFVILLPNTNCEEARLAANRLKIGLEKANHFIPAIEEHLGKKIDISDNRKLGFSMGICSNFEIEDPTDMNTTMTNADRSLYYSKEHGKNKVTVWTDIKDEYESCQKIESI